MTTESKVKPEVAAMAETIQGHMSVNKKEGKVDLKDEGTIYEKTLPEHITIKMAEDVSEHNAVFVPAALLAFGKVGAEALKGNKAAERLTAVIPMASHDKVSLTMDRKFVTHPPGDATKEITHYGYVSAKLDVRAGRNNASLKAARNEVCDLAFAALSK
jgi:hypothetical protein